MADCIPQHALPQSRDSTGHGIHVPAAAGGILIAPEHARSFTAAWFGDGLAGSRALAGGRGSVHLMQTPIGPLVRRDYLRGGLPRFLSRDLYLWTGAARTRAWREFHLTRHLWRQGLPVPEPVAARWRRRGPAYRASLLTRWLGQVQPLLDVLAGGSDPAILMPAVARAVAQLHDHHVWHADLNATNIQVDGQGKVWLIDFDRARDAVGDDRQLAGNLERLRRSLHKHLPRQPLAAVESAWPAFLAHYRQARAGR